MCSRAKLNKWVQKTLGRFLIFLWLTTEIVQIVDGPNSFTLLGTLAFIWIVREQLGDCFEGCSPPKHTVDLLPEVESPGRQITFVDSVGTG